MSNNIKHFVLGALMATLPMSYLVLKSIPANYDSLSNRSTNKKNEISQIFWFEKLENPTKKVKKFKTDEINLILSWFSPNFGISYNKAKETPDPANTPDINLAIRFWDKRQQNQNYFSFDLLTINKSIIKEPKNNKPKNDSLKKDPVRTASYELRKTESIDKALLIIEKYANEYGIDKEMMVHIAKCESGFRDNAVNGPYVGIYQFLASTWISNRNAMGLNNDPNLRYNIEESIKTAAFKMSRDGFGAWPVCQQKARNLIAANQ